MTMTLDELIAYLCDGDKANENGRELVTVEALMKWACTDCTNYAN